MYNLTFSDSTKASIPEELIVPDFSFWRNERKIYHLPDEIAADAPREGMEELKSRKNTYPIIIPL